jgi:tetratricopeptide (TPR) repeat protein
MTAVSAARPGEDRKKARQKVELPSTQSNMETRQALRGSGARLPSARLLGALALALLATGCSELQARHHARAGNSKFLEGDYAGAVREYEVAEQKYPGLAVVALNKGLACRQMMSPGSKSPEQQRAVDCATGSFLKMKELAPEDARGDRLYVQTLFDGDRFDKLVEIYEAQVKADPKNMAAINGLISVHSRADHWNEALRWAMTRADIDDKDAEEQYAVGAMIFARLYQKGGADKAGYDPRPDPNEAPPPPPKPSKRRGKKHAKAEPPPLPTKMPPPFAVGDVVGNERVRLADIGLKYLQRAIDLRPNYREAIGFISMIYRQKSFAYLEKPTEWEPLVNLANEWLAKANAVGNPTPAAPTTGSNSTGNAAGTPPPSTGATGSNEAPAGAAPPAAAPSAATSG